MFNNKIILKSICILVIQLLNVTSSWSADNTKLNNNNYPDTLVNNPIVFHSDLNSGWIGGSVDSDSDLPSDNIFKVYIDQDLPASGSVWLEYDAYGISNAQSAAVIVNDNTALGGYIVSPNNEWTTQREELDKSWIHKGLNRIQFSKLSSLDYKYQVKNLRLVMTATSEEVQGVEVKSIYALDSKKTYLRGFIRNRTKQVDKILINNEEVVIANNSFELLTEVVEEQVLKVIYADGTEELRLIEPHTISDHTITAGEIKRVSSRNYDIPALTPYQINNEDFGFEIDGQVLSTDLSLRMTELREVDLPPANNYMTNVTKTQGGYRLLPHGDHFSDEGAVLKMSYDQSKIPVGHTVADIRSFYFDHETSQWKALQRDSIDHVKGIIYSSVTNFT